MFSLSRIVLSLTLGLLPALSFAQTPVQGENPISIGFFNPGTTSGNTEYSVNVQNTTQSCLAFVPSNTKTLSKISWNISTITASPDPANIVIEVKADSSGFPSGSSVESRAVAERLTAADTYSAVPNPLTTAGLYRATGYSASVTGGSRYWACLKNTAGTAATNYVRSRVPDGVSNQIGPHYMGNPSKWGTGFCQSTDSGSTCATSKYAITVPDIEFSDGTHLGSGLGGGNTYTTESTNKVYDARELGTQGTLLADGPGMNFGCVSVQAFTSGTAPAGGARLRLYTGTGSSRTLVGTTSTIPNTNMPTTGNAQWIKGCFTSPVTIAAGTAVTVTLGAVSGGDASNYYSLAKVSVLDATAPKALGFLGGLKASYLNSTFTDDATAAYYFILHLDTNDPFSVSAGGPRQNQPGSGGMQ